jgi:hypothetical protein
VVETIRLESGHTLTGIGGSNPSLSAILDKLTTASIPTTVSRSFDSAPGALPSGFLTLTSLRPGSAVESLHGCLHPRDPLARRASI